MSLLSFHEITKDFPGTRALERVTFEVRSGEVLALLGENGAGKSTLMKILSGVWGTGTYEGEIRVDGKAVSFRDTRDAHRAGIAMIHQELSVFPELTVAEHLELDFLPRWIRWDELFARTGEFLKKIGIDLRPDKKVRDLSIGGRQMVEIARALYRDARILVFDEPTSALTEQEVVKLYEIVDRLKAEGRGIVYITHRMDEVFRLADRMVVLRDGKFAGETSAVHVNGKITRIPRAELEPKLIAWMVGRPIQDIYPPQNRSYGTQLLRVEGLTVQSPRGKMLVRNLSFSLREGEVLGIGGLLGAGRSETFEALFGVLNPMGPRESGYRVTGHIWIKGKRRDLGLPIDAIQARMAFVSEDRKGSGLILNQSVRKNMSLAYWASSKSLLAPVDESWEREEAEKWRRELRIRCAHVDQPVAELSGGNQQKVVLAKWLMTNPEILFLDEPTRGIDVGAKVEIYQWIQRLASGGMGIIVASSEMPELLGLSHRILVLKEGMLSAEISGERATQEEIMRAASL